MKTKPRGTDALFDLGFCEAGTWKLAGKNINADISSHATVRDFLYAFTSGTQILYIGKSTNTFAQRMAQYEQPGPTQKTNIRNNRDIKQLLLAGERVGIMVFIEPEPIYFRGYRVNLAAGLEDELIRRFRPKWNKLGKNRSVSANRSAKSTGLTSETPVTEDAKRSWESIKRRIRPGTKVRNWSKHSGYLEGSFTVTAVGPDAIEVDSPGAKNIQVVPRNDFEDVLAVWDTYMAGNLPRYKLRDMTRFSTYIISIIHHCDG
jgi:hypothetical protein